MSVNFGSSLFCCFACAMAFSETAKFSKNLSSGSFRPRVSIFFASRPSALIFWKRRTQFAFAKSLVNSLRMMTFCLKNWISGRPSGSSATTSGCAHFSAMACASANLLV